VKAKPEKGKRKKEEKKKTYKRRKDRQIKKLSGFTIKQ
jgi:hypothetical protein